MRAGSTRSPPQRLQSLPTSTTDRSPSLRGSHHSKVPIIPTQPLNTLLPVVHHGVGPHPQPFYLTQAVVLRTGDDRPPWRKVNHKAELRLLELWDSSAGLKEKVLNELIKDSIHENINSICSGYLVSATTRIKKDRQLLMWVHENIVEPTVYDEVEQSVYEELWDTARMLTESEIKPYASAFEDRAVDETFLTFLRDHHRNKPTLDQGKSIIGRKWGEVVYHLHQIVSKASLLENYAIRKLQEQFISQIATQVLFQEGIKYMEEEMKEVDEGERIQKPPRNIVA